MRHEIGDRHLTAREERRRFREQTDHDEDAEDNLQDGRNAGGETQEGHHLSSQHAELLQPVAEEQKSKHQAHQRIRLRCETFWNHAWPLLSDVTISLMASITIVVGLVLTLLGVLGYFLTGTSSLTALIPALFGLPLVV